jgi:uncharacterized caspase-like protein
MPVPASPRSMDGRRGPAINRALFLAVVLTCFAAFAGAARSETRVALVVGNASYQHAPVLKNSVNDALLISARLRAIGFDVITGADLDKRGFDDALRSFAAKAQGSDTAVFYYAGHGLQVDGENWLVPDDADIRTKADLDLYAVHLDAAMRMMQARAKVSIVFLDACRDDPFRYFTDNEAARGMTVRRGLAPVSSADGEAFVAFAAQPGATASDGPGVDSYFTTALGEEIATPDLKITDLMERVNRRVRAETQGKQIPWYNSGLSESFYFVTQAAAPVQARAVQPAPAASDASAQPIISAVLPGSVAPGSEVRTAVDAARVAQARGEKQAAAALLVQVSAKEAAQRAESRQSGYAVLQDPKNVLHYRYAGQVNGGRPDGLGSATYNGYSGMGLHYDMYSYDGQFDHGSQGPLGVQQDNTLGHFAGEASTSGDSLGGGFGIYTPNQGAFEKFVGFWSYFACRGVAYMRSGQVWIGDWQSPHFEQGCTPEFNITGYGAKFNAEGNVIEQGYYEKGIIQPSGPAGQ